MEAWLISSVGQVRMKMNGREVVTQCPTVLCGAERIMYNPEVPLNGWMQKRFMNKPMSSCSSD